MYAHLLQSQANITADILALVIGSCIAVACIVVRNFRRYTVLVIPEKRELTGCSETEAVACGNGSLHCLFEEVSAVALKGSTVRIADKAEHTDNSALLRSPREERS